MKSLWMYIDGKNWKANTKRRVAALILTAAAAVLGFLVWLAAGQWALPGIDWMLCFIGYPVLFAQVAIVIFLYNYGFHNGTVSEIE